MKMRKLYNTNTAFLDMLFNTLLAFVGLYVIAFVVMSANQKQSKNVDIKGAFMITVVWPKESDDDVDTYVEDPERHLVFFRRREDGLMHLDRDDLGKSSDMIQTQFGPVQIDENREIVTLRGTIPGEYTINVHMYSKKSPGPTPVTIQVEKLAPYQMVLVKQVVLVTSGDEKTAVRMLINKKGEVTKISHLEKTLTRRVEPNGH